MIRHTVPSLRAAVAGIGRETTRCRGWDYVLYVASVGGWSGTPRPASEGGEFQLCIDGSWANVRLGIAQLESWHEGAWEFRAFRHLQGRWDQMAWMLEAPLVGASDFVLCTLDAEGVEGDSPWALETLRVAREAVLRPTP